MTRCRLSAGSRAHDPGNTEEGRAVAGADFYCGRGDWRSVWVQLRAYELCGGAAGSGERRGTSGEEGGGDDRAGGADSGPGAEVRSEYCGDASADSHDAGQEQLGG